MAKFKVGDKVRVREDLVINEVYEDFYFNSEMSALKGKVIKIRRAEENGYNLEGNNWFWTDEMLEEVKEDKMEKTFREVIRDIKEGQVWELDQFEIKCYKTGTIAIRSTLTGKVFGFKKKDRFKLQRKEYTFEEAFKAYEEGKEIESFKGITYVKHYEEEYNEVISMEEIRGKWYIND